MLNRQAITKMIQQKEYKKLGDSILVPKESIGLEIMIFLTKNLIYRLNERIN